MVDDQSDVKVETGAGKPELPPEAPAFRKPDPWGTRRAELLIQSLKGVTNASVEVSRTGEIEEIHVIAEPGEVPKRVVRNVESALQAQLGIKVDHRKISVAPTAEPIALEVYQDAAVASKAKRRGVLFQKVEITSLRPNKVMVQVVLEHDGAEVRTSEPAGDTPAMRIQAAARAAVIALDSIVEEATLDLVGVKQIDAFETQFLFVGVNVLVGRHNWLHTGTCEVRRGAEQAAALAVLDATNRWLLNQV